MNAKDEQFRSIYKTYMPMLRVIARDKGIPNDEIDDLVQDTFASYYSHYPLDWLDYQIKATLVKTMKNRCIDYFRRQDTRPVTYWDPAMFQDNLLSENMRLGRDNLSIFLERQECKEVFEALKTMKEDWLQVLWLYSIEERPMDEVSEILGISVDACRARLSRGRKYLRKCLRPEAPETYRPTRKSGTSSLGNMANSREIPGST